MFVKPSSAFVANPSLVASSSGSAKKARYARLLPSTRKSSASRAGASSSSSSSPVSVFGDIESSVVGALNRTGEAADGVPVDAALRAFDAWMSSGGPNTLLPLFFVGTAAIPLLVLVHELGHAAVGLLRTEGLVHVCVGRPPR